MKSSRSSIFQERFCEFHRVAVSPGLLPDSAGRLQPLSGFLPQVSYSLYDSHANASALELLQNGRKRLDKPNVRSYITENYILVSRYVDDRAKLPILERFTYETTDKKKKEINTHGDKWATFEAENFQQVSQPLYAVVGDEEELLNSPVGYTPNTAEYLEWLQCAKNIFDEK